MPRVSELVLVLGWERATFSSYTAFIHRLCGGGCGGAVVMCGGGGCKGCPQGGGGEQLPGARELSADLPSSTAFCFCVPRVQRCFV